MSDSKIHLLINHKRNAMQDMDTSCGEIRMHESQRWLESVYTRGKKWDFGSVVIGLEAGVGMAVISFCSFALRAFRCDDER